MLHQYDCTKIITFPGRVLTRSLVPLEPIGSINHCPHSSKLSKGINNCGITEFNSLQQSVLPYFYRGDECYIVGGAGSGKSLSYIIPLMGKLIKEESENCSTSKSQESKKKVGKLLLTSKEGPLAIIVCGDKKSAVKIEGHLFALLSVTNQRHISYGLVCETKDFRKLSQGLDVIITTVTYFSHLIEKTQTALGFFRLKCVVYDDLDVLLCARFRPEFDAIDQTITAIAAKHTRFPLQRIYCGRDWSPEVENLYFDLKPLKDSRPCVPTVFVNSVNQAIKYSEMHWGISHCRQDRKLNQLISVLKSVELFEHKSIFVVCSSAEIARMVHRVLEQEELVVRLAETDQMIQFDFNQLRTEWKKCSLERKILVLNDSILKELQIYDVTCVIHYDLPEKNAYVKSSTGADRISCMWPSIRDITLEKLQPNSKYQRVKLLSYFFLTGTESCLYKLKTFSDKLVNCSFPPSLTAIAQEMGKEVLEKLTLCPGIKCFGKCTEVTPAHCKHRHTLILSELEKDPIIPRTGEIEVKIAECINPSLYTAQVYYYYEYKDGKKKLKWNQLNLFNTISRELKEHFLDEDNRLSPDSFKVGTLVAVESGDEFFRARILQIYTRTETNYPKHLRVFCIDSGNFMQPTSERLFSLPTQFEKIPQIAVELVLTNIEPVDGTNGYNAVVTEKAREITVNKILTAKLQFCVGETVWVGALADLKKESDGTVQTRASVRLELLREKLVDNNDNHLTTILDLCRRTGFVCPELEDMKSNPMRDHYFMSQFWKPGDEYRWAFVDTSSPRNPQMVEVWTSFIKNPYCIVATNAKFEKQLEDVQNTLDTRISEMIETRCVNYSVQFVSLYKEGMVVAVKDQVEKRWTRGLITKVSHCDDNGKTRPVFDVFLADIGDLQLGFTSAELFPIPKDLVNKLPFQAICFKLGHIVPVDGSNTWCEKTNDKLLDLTLDENNDGILVEVLPLQKQSNPYFPCRYYNAIMVKSDGEEVGEALVKHQEASFIENGLSLVQSVTSALLARLNQQYDAMPHNLDDTEDEEEYAGLAVDFDADAEYDVVGFADDPQSMLSQLGIKLKNGVSKLPQFQNEEISPSSPPLALSSSLENREQVPQPIGGFSSIKHPTVYWSQNREIFILRVDHPDIKQYTLNVEKKFVKFRTVDPPDYGFDIQLFGTIESNPQEMCTGQYLKIKFKKRTKWVWPRPLVEEVKLRWLREDLDLSKFPDEEEMMQNATVEDGLNVVDDDCEYDSDDVDDNFDIGAY